MSAKIHPEAQISPEATIGEGTEIGPKSIIDGFVVIGANCRIGQNVSIGPDVVIEDSVTIEDNATLTGPAWIEQGVHIFPNVRLGVELLTGRLGDGITRILKGSRILANATISTGVKIGPKSQVHTSARVVEDVLPRWVVLGDPAEKLLWFFIDGEADL